MSLALLQIAIVVTVLLGAAAVIAARFGPHRPRARRSAALGGIAAALVCLACQIVAPAVVEYELAPESTAVELPAPTVTPHPPAAETTSVAPQADPPRTTSASSAGPALALVLLAIWIAGAGLFLLRRLVGSFALWRLRAGAGPAPAALANACDEARLELEMTDRVIVVLCDHAVPMTWGMWRHVIALPDAALEWPSERVRWVLLHELAHLRHRDPAARWLLDLGVAAFWWNPIAWILTRMAAHDAEVLADLRVLATGVDGASYAKHLVGVLRELREPAPAFASQLGGTRGLRQRIEAILEDDARALKPSRWPRLHAIAWLGAALVAGVVQLSEASVADRAVPPEVLAAFARGLEDPMPPVRRAALNAARDTGTIPDLRRSIERLVDDPDPDVRRATGEVLGLRAPHKNLDLATRRPTRRAPVRAALDAIAQRLSDGDERERAAAVRELRALSSADVTVLLRRALVDPSAHVRQEAAAALGDARDPAAIDALAEALRDPISNVRQVAASALGQIGGSRVLEPLCDAIADPVDSVRQSVASALQHTRARGASGVLVDAAADRSAAVRQVALGALAALWRRE